MDSERRGSLQLRQVRGCECVSGGRLFLPYFTKEMIIARQADVVMRYERRGFYDMPFFKDSVMDAASMQAREAVYAEFMVRMGVVSHDRF